MMNAKRPFRGPGSLQNSVESLYDMIFFHLAKDALQWFFSTSRKMPCSTSARTGVCVFWELKVSWWRHQIETFSALLPLCEGNPPFTGGFPSQRPVTRSFDVFFNLRLNKGLNKHSGCRWFETPSRSLWPLCNDGLYHRFVIVTSWAILCYSKAWFLTHSRTVTSWNLT